MIRTLLWILSGIVLGLAIHLGVILGLPLVASRDVWSQVATVGALDKTVVLPRVAAGAANPLGLDPDLSYAVCQVNLSAGPGEVRATLPSAFWSLAVFDRAGTVIYSTTNRDGIGQNLDLGIFNPAQTRLLAERQIDIADGLLIVESQDDDVFVVVRLAPAQEAMRPRFEKALAGISCGNIG